jgi:NitT/TauT family transport system permease protein
MTRHRFQSSILPPLAVALVVLVAIEAVVQLGWIASFLVPPPTRVAIAMVERSDLLLEATAQTALGAGVGFALAGVVGVLIAIALSSSKLVQRMFYPYAVFFQTVPIVAIAPMLVIWFGNSINAVIASAAIVCVFPIIANTLTGLLSTDPALVDLFKLYRARRISTLLKLRIPFALPSILTGLRVGAGLSVVGAIVGEFITTGSGLGGLMTIARQQQRVDLVFAALLLSAVLGIAMFVALNIASNRLLRHWHASESGFR